MPFWTCDCDSRSKSCLDHMDMRLRILCWQSQNGASASDHYEMMGAVEKWHAEITQAIAFRFHRCQDAPECLFILASLIWTRERIMRF